MNMHAFSRKGLVMLGASVLLAGALTGCGAGAATSGSGSASGASSQAEPVELQVFAANSLEKALPEVQKLYTEQTGVTFTDTQFKASGDLVEQMRAGAPVDVLITASKGTMDDAAAGELVDESTRLDMFNNDLVVARAEGSDIKIESLADVANVDGKIAIGDAITVPAGKYANQALHSVGLYTGAEGDDGEYAPEFAGRVALADKVGTAAKYVSTGDAAIGFVYSSDIFRYEGIEQAFVCPDDSHKPIVYPGAVSASSKHAKAAQDFLDFCMNNAEAQKIWATYGFELAE
ncbi:MAG: molybdate ABC transporter substrate-binding protein [Coriobacteriaceae bacterium]|nr:molybdate ABC transporter substrate-binding protein [Coriobacteriaceae bacterium]